MYMVNMVYLVGRIANNPYLVDDDSTDIPYVFQTLHVPSDREDADGNKITEYVYFWVEGEMARSYAKHCRAGDLIGLSGELRTDDDNDKFVYVKKLSFLASKTNEEIEKEEEE